MRNNITPDRCFTTSLRKAIRYSVNYLSRDKCTGAEEPKTRARDHTFQNTTTRYFINFNHFYLHVRLSLFQWAKQNHLSSLHLTLQNLIHKEAHFLTQQLWGDKNVREFETSFGTIIVQFWSKILN